MNANIPSISPLQLRSHQFTLVHVFSNPGGNSTAPTTVNQFVGFSPVPDQPNQWNLQLQLKMGSASQDAPFFYEVEIHVLGVVELSDGIPAENREQIAVINGFSMLYGACRELLINVTCRSIYGPVSIPSLNFSKVLQEAQEHQKAEQAQLSDREKGVSASLVQ
jgi:preprotein translocase subunit SecB